jgi:anthranilate synthase component 1
VKSGGRVLHRLDRPVEPFELLRRFPARYPYLLESTAPHPRLGRYDILFAAPRRTLVLERVGALDDIGGFLGALDAAFLRECEAGRPPGLPFGGGWFLFLGYELAGEIEPALELVSDPVLPAAFAARCTAAMIRDRADGSVTVVAEQDAAETAERMVADAELCLDAVPPSVLPEFADLEIDEEPEAPFLNAVEAARRHIARGDIYQANLSRAWCARAARPIDPWALYAALRRANPGPFAGFVRWGDAAIVSSSPERLLSIGDGQASTRPIAGTRPRGADPDRDDRLSAELIGHPKELAEHVMLIDLERNDLGRICAAGSVEVDEKMVIETYAHVHHIVSNVRGALKPGVTPGTAIRAVFPGGTITGCPKVRCMQIIRELEGAARGAYTGSFGYLDRDGSLDLNILIRTMVVSGNQAGFRAGSGIVADSEPLAELAETRAKAKGLLRAFES